MNRKAWLSILLILISGSLFSFPFTNPTYVTPHRGLRGSLDMSVVRRVVKQPGDDAKLNSYRALAKPAYGILPLVEIFGLIGAGDFNMKSLQPKIYDDYNGSWEIAMGGGLRIYVANLYLFQCYTEGLFYTNYSRDKVWQSDEIEYETDFRWREYAFSGYGSIQFGSLRFFVGAQWVILEATIHRDTYRHSGDTRYQVNIEEEYFLDPTQMPKPIVGVELQLPRYLVLNLELTLWKKDELSFSLGASQLKE